MFVITVTYGNTNPDTVYARAETMEAAELLLAAARKRGYRDATIVPEKEFREAQEARRRSRADKREADSKASGVHDLRSLPDTALEKQAG